MSHVPFPGRMFYDVGDSFITGCSIGSMWYFLKGAYFALPKERIKGGLHLVRAKATGLGGSFASWSFFYSLSHCTSSYIRKKNDPLNSIIAGFSTGFILSIRSGIKSAIKNGLTGCFVLTTIETLVMLSQQYQRRILIIQENKTLLHIKKQYEKKGIRFLPNQGYSNDSINRKI